MCRPGCAITSAHTHPGIHPDLLDAALVALVLSSLAVVVTAWRVLHPHTS